MRQFLPRLLNDVSSSSLQELIGRTEFYLSKKYGIIDIWFPDSYETPDPKQEMIDIVLTGDFLRRLLNPSLWVNSSYRFWCLSTAVKKVLVNLFGFAEQEIGLVPRYELFPIKDFFGNFDNPFLSQRPVDLIYAGKLSCSKRILTLLNLTAELQKKYDLPVRLHLFGSHYDESQISQGLRENPYEREIKSTVGSLDWDQAPRFYGQVETNTWLNMNYENPIYISLSVLAFEDFGVSLAQAQQKCWPIVTNKWGGYGDVCGLINMIPNLLLVPFAESVESSKRSGVAVAEYLVKSSFSNLKAQGQVAPIPPQVSAAKLIALREALIQNWGADILRLPHAASFEFSKENRTLEFIRRYNACFASIAYTL